jgi:hypothetical protein
MPGEEAMSRHLNRRQVLSATGTAIVAGMAMSGQAAASGHGDGPRSYSTELTGEEQVPPVETDASGHATFETSADGTAVEYEIHVESICNVTQAHVHLGEEGENGPVVVWLYPEDAQEPELIEGRFDGTLASGTITEDDLVGPLEGASFEEAAESLEAEGMYVNVHTEQHPDGEIRGQIRPEEAPEEPVEEEEPDEEEEESPTDVTFSLGDINVGESVEPEGEFITIVNEGDQVNLSGFVLRDGPGGVVDAGTVNAFTFPSYSFDEGESITVYTDDNSAADFSWGIGRQIWNQEGDTVIVENPDGEVVLEETYESQVSSLSAAFGFVRSLFA